MSKGNSINGYAIAVRLRKKKTFLVEGKGDRRLIKRLAANLDSLSPDDFITDTAEILNSQDIALNEARGNKSKVLAVAHKLSKNEKFAAMVDREWDGLWDGQSWLPYIDPVQRENLYTTLGHSIENYGFSESNFHRKILARCYESIARDAANEVVSSFLTCLKMAISVSQEALQSSTISRMSGLLRPENFNWDAPDVVRMVPTDRMRYEFDKRGLGDSEAYCADINGLFLADTSEIEGHIKYYTHGHLGEEVLFSTVCARLLTCGASNADIEILFSESLENREIALKEYIESHEELPEPFGRIVAFLRKPN